MYFITIPAPRTADAIASAIVLISPEVINAIIRKVTKNISAVPKSLIKISEPTHATEKPIYAKIFLLVCIFSSVAAPTKINAILTNSDG